MLFKKWKVSNLLEKWRPLSEPAWDDETTKWIASRGQLDVRLTHISQTASFGQVRVGGEGKNTAEWEMHGVMTHPKLIPVNITFTTDEEKFGGWSYDRQDDQDFGGRKINLPLLRLWQMDRGDQKTQLLYTALRDAIISGQKYAGVRFWKKEGEGLMTQIDKEHGYSYQSGYTILGMVTWSELHAAGLPKWALPTSLRDFSLDSLPKSRFDLDGQVN